MNKELRAVVLGLVVVVLIAVGISIWRRPAAEFHRIRGFRVQIKKTDGGETRTASFNVPVSLLARMASLAHMEDLGGDIRRDWAHGRVTPKRILEAADESLPGKPGVIREEDSTVEVVADGEMLQIDVKDDWGKRVHIRLPRLLVEAISEDHPLSIREILGRLDELGPDDVVTIQDEDSEVTITALPRRHPRTS
jgi:hypothetical protein